MHHNSLFVFDIETVIDHKVANNLLNIDSNDINECKQAILDYHLKITNGSNSFPRQPFHKVVAISFLRAEISRLRNNQEKYKIIEIRSGGNINSNEKDLLQGFFNFLKKDPPRLVSFNGRCFDLSVLKYRAIKYNIAAPWLYKTGDKWNNYTHRYSLDWHCDLLEAFSDFGASARVKMNELCATFSLPGKISMDGSLVDDYYREGKIEEIRNYCELDVLNTYLLYLNYQHHNGSISSDNFPEMKNDLSSHLKKMNKKHFDEFLNS